MHAEIKALTEVVDKLNNDNAKFARSLLKQADKRGSLSDKQMYWVRTLTTRATQPQAETVDIANVAGVVALLTKASEHLRFPKLLVRVDRKITLRLSIAGDRSKAPGSINVAGTEDQQWFGRISPQGVFVPGRAVAPETATAVAVALQALAADPAKVAAEYGKLTGSCCFCGAPLSDERSTSVGYGPVCAEHWGMPWGNTTTLTGIAA